MICEIIKKRGEKGSGGGHSAFRPGVAYVCGKAVRVELRNLATTDWQNAAREMLLISELSRRVEKPYYHLVLSWHKHERPTQEQMFAAMDHLIRTLGLEEHQIVIGDHDDRPGKHIHAVVNTVHPISGLVWSKSNDQQKAELACRQIELDQGWSHDRGRFDFTVVEHGGQKIVELQPAPDAWEKKKEDRAAGKRRPAPGDVAFQKHHGFESFSQSIPPALKDRFAQAVALATDWPTLHAALAPLGLLYRKHGSGARVHLVGSQEFAKASAFGQAFSIAGLQARFGPYRDAEPGIARDHKTDTAEIASVTGKASKEHEKATKSASFKMTLLRRVYTGLHLDDEVSRQILFVDLDGKPPRITFRDHSAIADHGDLISASAVTEATIKATVAMAKAKGWAELIPTGSPEYVRGIAMEAARSGLSVSGVPEDIQALADEILQRGRKQQSLDAAVEAALTGHLGASADREVAVANNISDVARAAADAIFAEDDAPRTKARAPGRPPVPDPQPAPDAANWDRNGAHRIARQRRDNEWGELEDMKRVDIGIIAAMGGWADVSRTHPDSADAGVVRYRIFQQGHDTIKASLVDGKWLWTSNKSGESGSVIDLWLHDNPDTSLGMARATFREILGTVPTPAPASEPSRAPEVRDHTQARQRWEEAPHVSLGQSYAQARGISRDTLMRFSDEVRQGAFGGIYFAHRNPGTGDIQGFEQRWEKDGRKNVARFAKGGRKTVNVLGDPETATRLIVVEGGLDALALAELEERQDTIYVSTGGGFGPQTETALIRLADGKAVLSGFDNDEAGENLDKKLRALLPERERLAPPVQVKGVEVVCKDWLDNLVAVRSLAAQTPAKAATPVPATAPPVAPAEDAEKQDTTPVADEQEPVSPEPQDDCDGPDFP